MQRKKRKMADENTNQPVNFGDRVVGEVEIPRIDLDPYIGKDAKIEYIEEFEGKHGPYVKLSTGIIETIEHNGKKIELKASRVLGLVVVEKDGKEVIGWGADSKTAAFLKAKGVAHYNDLLGKDVKVQTQTNKEQQTFLSF